MTEINDLRQSSTKAITKKEISSCQPSNNPHGSDSHGLIAGQLLVDASFGHRSQLHLSKEGDVTHHCMFTPDHLSDSTWQRTFLSFPIGPSVASFSGSR